MRAKNCAFTLLEVIMALALVSIALVALVRMHVISVNMADLNNINTRAALLAQQKMAETLAKGYPQIGIAHGSALQDGCQLHWKTEVRDLHLPQSNPNDIGPLRDVWVTVNWAQGNIDRRLSLNTYVAIGQLP